MDSASLAPPSTLCTGAVWADQCHSEQTTSRQFAALCARIRAKFTLVRLLPRVAPFVHGQVAAVLEHFPAELTGVVPAPGDELLPGLRVK